MKKIFAAILVALIGFCSFAETETEKEEKAKYGFAELLFDGSAFVCFGVGFPQTTAKVSMNGNDKLYMSGYMFDCQVMSIKKSSMVLLLNVELGAGVTRNIGDDTESGLALAMEFGVGKAFLNGKEIKESPFYFGVDGLVGFDTTFFLLSDSATAKASAFSLGGDVFAIWQMHKKFCIFADIKMLLGFGALETTPGNNSWGLIEFKFKPTIGGSIKLK